ncbi:F0F1 ATP synthase subunit alpha [Ferrovibrio sp.]|uniref:F0F1 ATP synthase subunit alpha n=1 Tax=Ferrovibrio sp. TaxID=1917215 RepID=UPI001B5BC3EB|nr:F0F1 ATP synthase subunit alpha [Ferrovibrio sp.]MBP7063237.1 F0F1 ATP synthase subunit alpha [Ferrovibrio sp.]
MNGLNTDLSLWRDHAARRIAGTALQPHHAERGRIESIADGIALVSGLPSARLNELLVLPDNRFGFVRHLGVDTLACILLDSAEAIEAGQIVTGTGDVVRTAVGAALLGRVVDPLGRPLDGKGDIPAASHEPIERAAPGIIDRDLISEPLQTGILAVDTMFPIGRGQRELIVGDRSSGKTTLAVDAILNQRDSDVICIYVSIGQKMSNARRVIETIAQLGPAERCITVVASASSTPGMQWIAPFAGFSIAEYFRDRGQHVLIVLDDLSKHAATHRELALLTRQPPGREAYPGDIFYLHARLLERAAKLNAALGGGSLTALPIAETDAGNLSAYIPTNLISITDGQIVLDAKLFHEGQKPAVDIGRSVSRVGGKAQSALLRQEAGMLRLDYAQFLELEIFSRLGGAGNPRLQRQMQRGRAIRAILAQPANQPMRLGDQAALLVAVREGHFDGMAPEQIKLSRQQLGAWLDRHANGINLKIADGTALDAPTRAGLQATLAAYFNNPLHSANMPEPLA